MSNCSITIYHKASRAVKLDHETAGIAVQSPRGTPSHLTGPDFWRHVASLRDPLALSTLLGTVCILFCSS